jgi:hypothetical protein
MQYGEMIFFSPEGEENFEKLSQSEKDLVFSILAESIAETERKLQSEFLEKID